MKLVCLDSITTEEYLQLEREMHRSIRNRRLTASHSTKKIKSYFINAQRIIQQIAQTSS